MDNLPLDCVGEIISFIGTPLSFLNLYFCSKTFHYYVNEHYPKCSSYIIFKLRYFTYITKPKPYVIKLYIYTGSVLKDDLFHLFPNLECLIMKNKVSCKICPYSSYEKEQFLKSYNGNEPIILYSGFKELKYLKELELSNCKIDDKFIDANKYLLKTLEKLTVLRCGEISGDSIEKLENLKSLVVNGKNTKFIHNEYPSTEKFLKMGFLRKLKNLEYFSVRGDFDFVLVAPLLVELEKLNHLELLVYNLNEKDIPTFIPDIKKYVFNIEKLSITSTKGLSHDQSKFIFVKYFQNLKVLELKKIMLTIDFFEALKVGNCIKKLSLKLCSFGYKSSRLDNSQPFIKLYGIKELIMIDFRIILIGLKAYQKPQASEGNKLIKMLLSCLINLEKLVLFRVDGFKGDEHFKLLRNLKSLAITCTGFKFSITDTDLLELQKVENLSIENDEKITGKAFNKLPELKFLKLKNCQNVEENYLTKLVEKGIFLNKS